ncbi:MAG: hypothetical protein WCB27_23810 [Thermoguttaceae bacterium]|jgi:hypothetical protein
MAAGVIAGAATADVTPDRSQFLFGYPHVRRYSTGVHDRLLSSALFLGDGATSLLWVANDVIYIGRQTAGRAGSRSNRAGDGRAGGQRDDYRHPHAFGPADRRYAQQRE